MGVEGGDGEGEDKVSAIRADTVREIPICAEHM